MRGQALIEPVEAGRGVGTAAAGAAAVRVVTAKADRPKTEMLAALSLRVADEWWVKPLTATGQASAGMSHVTGTG